MSKRKQEEKMGLPFEEGTSRRFTPVLFLKSALSKWIYAPSFGRAYKTTMLTYVPVS